MTIVQPLGQLGNQTFRSLRLGWSLVSPLRANRTLTMPLSATQAAGEWLTQHLGHSPRAAMAVVPLAVRGPPAVPLRSCTGFTVLNPAYQNPDRRGRAGIAHDDKDDRG